MPHARVIGLRWVNQRTNIRFGGFQIGGYPKEILTIGRAPVCDIVLPEDDTKVSRIHCVLGLWDGQHWSLGDRSKNGTYIYRSEDPYAWLISKDESIFLSINMEIFIGTHRFLPMDPEGNIGLLVTNKQQLGTKAFERYGKVEEASNHIGLSTSTIYRVSNDKPEST